MGVVRLYVIGIDEAGRGPVIGPMVMACVVVREDRVSNLVGLGVRDSKQLTRSRREAIFSVLREVADYITYRVVPPDVIDSAVEGRCARNLNDLEARICSELIADCLSRFSSSEVLCIYVDSPDPVPHRYSSMVKRYLLERGVGSGVSIVADNHAESKYVVVAAASIVAKVLRDREIDELKRIYGDFGSGYVTDPKTISFLEDYVRKFGELPPCVRKSWSTARKVLSRCLGTRLTDFM